MNLSIETVVDVQFDESERNLLRTACWSDKASELSSGDGVHKSLAVARSKAIQTSEYEMSMTAEELLDLEDAVGHAIEWGEYDEDDVAGARRLCDSLADAHDTAKSMKQSALIHVDEFDG